MADRIVPDTYATLAAAVAASSDNDTIRIKDGTYSGTGNRNVSIPSGLDNLTIEAYTPGSTAVVFDGEEADYYFCKSDAGTSANTVFRDLTIVDYWWDGNSDSSGICADGSEVTIESCRFDNIRQGNASGYGAAVAREVVGPAGLVVSVEIDPITLDFARGNLERAGYRDIILVEGDGGSGYPELGPYDSIAVTAACIEVPAPLVEQLKTGGRLIAPVHKGTHGAQDLVLLARGAEDIQSRTICEVLYVSLRGRYAS